MAGHEPYGKDGKDPSDAKGDQSAAAGAEKSVAGAVRQDGRFAYDGLQRVIHEKSRLGILSSLASNPASTTTTSLRSGGRSMNGDRRSAGDSGQAACP